MWIHSETRTLHDKNKHSPKPFIDKYNWEGINYPSEKEDWKNFEKNNLTIAINVLYAKKEEICPAYVSKQNLKPENML